MTYPKPGPTGGKLIRTVVEEFKRLAPFDKKRAAQPGSDQELICAVSGGPDSMALAHLLLKYGRRITSPKRITLLYIDHGWRPEVTPHEAKLVRKLAQEFGAQALTRKINWAKVYNKGESREACARRERKKIYQAVLKLKKAPFILTAHHADDRVETLLWRFCTGQLSRQMEGIRFREGSEVRPLLKVRKQLLVDYLKEEGIPFSHDESNADIRFLRVQIRNQLLPMMESIFPQAVKRILEWADFEADRIVKRSACQSVDETIAPRPPEWDSAQSLLRLWSQQSQVRLSPEHWKKWNEFWQNESWEGELSLPRGWTLSRNSGVAKKPHR